MRETLKRMVKKGVPRPWLRAGFRWYWLVTRAIARRRYAGSPYYCPVCSTNLRAFLPDGIPPRPNALCPVCGSNERHRLSWLFMQAKTNLLDKSPKRMLHVAPELCLEMNFRRLENLEYLSSDRHSALAMIEMDLTAIGFPANSFDVIHCSYVLQYIPDDSKAIGEIYRVLKPGGWALLLVPVTAERTWEDPAIVDPRERQRAFGNPGHVRRCGPDYIDRIASAGFETRVFSTLDIVEPGDCQRMGIPEGRLIFYCCKN